MALPVFPRRKGHNQARCHGNPNGSRKRRVYYGADGAAGKRIRDCVLVGTCYDIDRVADNRLLTNSATILTNTTGTQTLLDWFDNARELSRRALINPSEAEGSRRHANVGNGGRSAHEHSRSLPIVWVGSIRIFARSHREQTNEFKGIFCLLFEYL